MRDPAKLLEAHVWPPAPVGSQAPKTAPAVSRERLGLLTRFYLLDFFVGLALGPVVFFVLFFGFGIMAEWVIPTLPVPKAERWVDWCFPTLEVIVLCGVFIRRYPYLVIGFATTSLILAGIVFFFVLCFS